MTSLQGTVRTGPVAGASQATPDAATTIVITTARLTFEIRRGEPRGSIFQEPARVARSRTATPGSGLAVQHSGGRCVPIRPHFHRWGRVGTPLVQQRWDVFGLMWQCK